MATISKSGRVMPPVTGRRSGPALFVVAALLLAGCKVGPDYRRPAVETPSDWRWKAAEPRDQVPRGEWWKVFAEPELDALMGAAREANQDLQAALARVEQARLAARMSRADLFPTLTGGAQFARYRTSGNSPSPVPFPVPSFTQSQWQIPFDVSYEVDLWGRVRRGFESAREQALATEAARQSLLLSVQAEVAVNYLTLQTVRAQADLLERTIQIRQEALDLIRQRVEVGMSSDFEFERGRGEVENARAELAVVRQRAAELAHALAVLCGRAPAAQAEPAAKALPRLPRIGADLPSHLLERRPDVAEAERQLAARNAQIGVARAAFFPSVRLTGAAGVLSGDVKDLFEWESRIWSIGPGVSLPLFQGGRNRAGLARARAAYEEGVAQYRQRVLVAFREVEDSLAAAHFLDEQAAARVRAAEAATQAARLAYERYRAGAVNFLEIVDSEQARLRAETARVLVVNEQLLATVRLIKALGGGWE